MKMYLAGQICIIIFLPILPIKYSNRIIIVRAELSPKILSLFLVLLGIKVIFATAAKCENNYIIRKHFLKLKYPKLATLILWIDNLIGRQPTNIFYLDCLLKQHKLLSELCFKESATERIVHCQFHLIPSLEYHLASTM